MTENNNNKTLSLFHYNDLYKIEKAPRFVYEYKQKLRQRESSGSTPICIFSGDGFSPSAVSAVLRGRQMIPIFAELELDAACLGNHDLDFGLMEFGLLKKMCPFPWICSNAKMANDASSQQLGNCEEYVVLNKNNIKVLVLGIIEYEWIDAVAALDPDDVAFEDFVTYCNRRIPEISTAEGPFDLVVASSHMRMPNDKRLATECGHLIDIVLGGHDHHYEDSIVNKIHVLNSGTDFSDFTIVDIQGSKLLSANIEDLKISSERVEIIKEGPVDDKIKAATAEILDDVEASMDIPVGTTKVDLDARFQSIRSKETNISSFLAQLMARGTQADIAILNAGSIRADRIIPKGTIKIRDLKDLLPRPEGLAVIKLTAERVLLALENGVSKYPALDGRFPCVDGIRFEFDPDLPPGSRILPNSVYVRDTTTKNNANGDDNSKMVGTERYVPIDMSKSYNVVGMAFLIKSGKDGYDKAFLNTNEPLVKDEELCPMLIDLVRNLFTGISVLKRWAGITSQGTIIKAATVFKKQVRHSSVDPYAIRPMTDGRITNIRSTEKEEELSSLGSNLETIASIEE